MTIKLTKTEHTEIIGIQRELLALENTKSPAAVRSALIRMRKVVNAKCSFAYYFFDGSPIIIPDKVGDQLENYLLGSWISFDSDGFFVLHDKELEAINRIRRSLGSGVHHEAKLGSREAIEQSRFWQEGFAPAGMTHVIGMSCALPVGEAVFAFGFEGAKDPGFAGDHSERLMDLCLPAFESGFTRLYDQSSSRDMVLNSLAHLPVPAALVEEGSQIVGANRAGAERTHEDWERCTGSETVFQVPGPVLEGLRASYILLDLTPSAAQIDIASVASTRGLTPRQAQVAELLMQGKTDKEAALVLGISQHTVHRHVEKIFESLEVNSRTAAVMALLEGAVPAPR